MSKSELKGGSLADAARCAEAARMSKGYKVSPPPGPKTEPQKLNGVPAIREKGVSR